MQKSIGTDMTRSCSSFLIGIVNFQVNNDVRLFGWSVGLYRLVCRQSVSLSVSYTFKLLCFFSLPLTCMIIFKFGLLVRFSDARITPSRSPTLPKTQKIIRSLTSPWPLLAVGRLVGRLVGWMVVCHNKDKGGEVTLPFSYQSTCL